MTQRYYIVGVDEVGRGPVAGPVCVCAVRVLKDFDFNKYLPGLNDSKAISKKKRNQIFEIVEKMQEEGHVIYALSYESAETIDSIGIAKALKKALNNSIKKLNLDVKNSHIFLDGSLKADDMYSQETIIKGDSLIPVISLASVIAKVSRDALMIKECKKYPEYGFSKHKGYGTKLHMEAIKNNGISPLHRKSFLSNVIN